VAREEKTKKPNERETKRKKQENTVKEINISIR
jgi:hypothetical protein